MGRMTAQSFNRPGAFDLSSLATSPAATTAGAGGSASASGPYVVNVTEATLDSIVRQSMQYPVVLEITSPRAQGHDTLTRDLVELSTAGAGDWLLARVDVDAEPGIAQAMGVTSVPMVVAIIGGQLAPMFQGAASKAQIAPVLAEVIKMARSNGIVGKVTPGASASGAGGTDAAEAVGDEAPVDPRFAAADAAMAKGDFAGAVTEFEKLISANPADAEAIAGRAQAALLDRSMKVDPASVVAKAAADENDIDAQLDAADLELIQGDPAGAFDRLIGVIRDTTGDDRERVRVRLLELFETVGKTDPSVLKARRALSTALF